MLMRKIYLREDKELAAHFSMDVICLGRDQFYFRGKVMPVFGSKIHRLAACAPLQ